jgi:hypothetical protein
MNTWPTPPAGLAAWAQTLFERLPEIREVTPVREGTGQGAFLVVRGAKR